MARYLLRRFVYLIVVVLVVTFSVSLMLSLPKGDPAVALAGEDASPAQVEALRHELNLDKPVLERYLSWLGNAVQGDFGRSLRTGESVLDTIKQRLPVTLELVVVAQALALLFAVPLALYGANRPGKALDTGSTVMSFLMISFPTFIAGVLLIRFLASSWGDLPVGGWTFLTEDPRENFKHVILPAIALALEPAGIYQRLLRTDTRKTLDEDFIMMAESKGLRPRTVLFRHGLRPSSFSLLTLFGIVSARLVGGSVVVETIFSLPGLGKLLYESIGYRDFIMVQGVVAVVAVGYVVLNSIVDVAYGLIDPRVRVDAA
jgi:peptide/nickel transport system permease protein